MIYYSSPLCKTDFIYSLTLSKSLTSCRIFGLLSQQETSHCKHQMTLFPLDSLLLLKILLWGGLRDVPPSQPRVSPFHFCCTWPPCTPPPSPSADKKSSTLSSTATPHPHLFLVL